MGDFRNFVAKTDEKQKTKDEMNRTMDSVNQNFCLTRDLIMVGPTKIANDLKINFVRIIVLVCF